MVYLLRQWICGLVLCLLGIAGTCLAQPNGIRPTTKHSGATLSKASTSEAHLLETQDEAVALLYQTIVRRGTDYVAQGPATLFARSDSTQPVAELAEKESFHRLRQKGAWTRIRTRTGRVGYLATEAISNVWIYVSKNERMVYLYEGLTLKASMPADFGINIKGDKLRRGGYRNPDDWRTPEGIFYITRKNARSRFYKALVLNYPTPSHAARAKALDIISRYQYNRIVKAHMVLKRPPMNTPMGGMIEFHGYGITGQANWTWGCVALENKMMDVLWEWADVGTPVLIGRHHPRRKHRHIQKIEATAPILKPVRVPAPTLRRPNR